MQTSSHPFSSEKDLFVPKREIGDQPSQVNHEHPKQTVLGLLRRASRVNSAELASHRIVYSPSSKLNFKSSIPHAPRRGLKGSGIPRGRPTMWDMRSVVAPSGDPIKSRMDTRVPRNYDPSVRRSLSLTTALNAASAEIEITRTL